MRYKTEWICFSVPYPIEIFPTAELIEYGRSTASHTHTLTHTLFACRTLGSSTPIPVLRDINIDWLETAGYSWWSHAHTLGMKENSTLLSRYNWHIDPDSIRQVTHIIIIVHDWWIVAEVTKFGHAFFRIWHTARDTRDPTPALPIITID